MAILVLAPAAQAEVRTATVQDPQDATPTLSGVPNNPDIRQVLATYDSALGSLTIQVDFYNSINSLDKSQNYKFFANFRVGEGRAESLNSSNCYLAGSTGDITSGQHNVIGSFYDQASVSGFSGNLPFSRTNSADGRTITISASSPALLNRGFSCIEYSLFARSYSSISNPYSDYDEGCGCWYLSSRLDSIREKALDAYTKVSVGNWFDGFLPPPAVTPAPALVTPKLKVNSHAGCRRVTARWNVQPWIYDHPATGTIRMKLGGGAVREFPGESTDGVTWNHVRPGFRVLRVSYLGDDRRLPAKVERKLTIRGNCRA